MLIITLLLFLLLLLPLVTISGILHRVYSYCSRPSWRDLFSRELRPNQVKQPALALRAWKWPPWGCPQGPRCAVWLWCLCSSSAGEQPWLFPVRPILSRRLTGFCAAVISDQLSSLCLAAFCQEVLFPCGSLIPPGDQNGRWGGDKRQGGDCWDMVLVALFTRPSLWLSMSKPPGNTLSVFPLNTNQATLATHILCQTCQLLQGPRTACKRCLLLLLWWCVISPFNSSAFVLLRGVNTEVPAVWEVLTENVKLTWTIQWPS